eukprot:TRINITY_DN1407_c0_g2_i1.p1 TRINITY_DN1407_c0_g2~~TRINITY_DN1407_c0_g2_i1.p1  ORF type:complete len:296 (+),score=91.55 TRINITY_DN1407_c0_g2_i1:31-888(+)
MESSSSLVESSSSNSIERKDDDRLDKIPLTDSKLVDPSTSDGYRIIYDKDFSAEIRVKEDSGSLVQLKVKILFLGQDDHPEAVRVELSSDDDLFFHYYHTLDFAGFRELQSRQKLKIDFPEYPGMLVSLFDKIIKEPLSYLSLLYLLENGTGRLDVVQNLDFKFVELLSLFFTQSPPEVVRQQIQYRFHALKWQVMMLQARLTDVNALVKLKQPSLLLQLKKTPLGSGASSASRSKAIISSSSSSSSSSTTPYPSSHSKSSSYSSSSSVFRTPPPTSSSTTQRHL